MSSLSNASVFASVLAAAWVVQLATELEIAVRKDDGSTAAAEFIGGHSGRLLRWSLDLVDAGANPHDVRSLIDAGGRAANENNTAELAMLRAYRTEAKQLIGASELLIELLDRSGAFAADGVAS